MPSRPASSTGVPGAPSARGEATCWWPATACTPQIRTALYPDEGPPLWNGITMWRGTTLRPPFLTGRSMAMAGHFSRRMVIYPIAEPVDGLQLINWVAEAKVADDQPMPKQDWELRRAPRRRDGALRRLPVRLARRPGAGARRQRDLPVPDGRPRPARPLDLRPGDPAGRRRAPDVPRRVQRCVAGDPRRPVPGPRAGPRILGRRGSRGVRGAAPAGDVGDRAGQPPGGTGALHGDRRGAGPGRLHRPRRRSSPPTSWRPSPPRYRRTAGFDPSVLNERPSLSVSRSR